MMERNVGDLPINHPEGATLLAIGHKKYIKLLYIYIMLKD